MAYVRVGPNTAFLEGEQAHRRAMTALLTLLPREGRPPCTLEELRDRVAGRLPGSPSYRMRVAFTPLGLATPAWIDDVDFDLFRHVRNVELGAAGPAELAAAVSEIVSRPIDLEHAPWECHLVEGLPDGAIALIGRAHHCMGDAMSVFALLGGLILDGQPEPSAPMPDSWRPRPEPSARELIAAALGDRARGWRRRASSAARAAVTPARWAAAAREAARVPGTVQREFVARAPRTPLDAVLGEEMRVGFTQRPLHDLKRLAHARPEAATVNDVVVAAVAGGLRAWLERRGEAARPMRAFVPVRMNGYASTIYVDLPLDEPDPLRRLDLVRRETTERKGDRDALTIARIGATVELLPRIISRPAMRWLYDNPRRYNLALSDFPGPSTPMFVLGHRLGAFHPFAIPTDHFALNVTATSTMDRFCFGLTADAGAVPDLDVIVEGIDGAIDELVAHGEPGA